MDMDIKLKRKICEIWVLHKENEYSSSFYEHIHLTEYINNFFNDLIKTEKEELFKILSLPRYFTVWDGYVTTPISWDPVTGDRWIADINNPENEDYNIYDWILDNNDYLWDIFEYHILIHEI